MFAQYFTGKGGELSKFTVVLWLEQNERLDQSDLMTDEFHKGLSR